MERRRDRTCPSSEYPYDHSRWTQVSRPPMNLRANDGTHGESSPPMSPTPSPSAPLSRPLHSLSLPWPQISFPSIAFSEPSYKPKAGTSQWGFSERENTGDPGICFPWEALPYPTFESKESREMGFGPLTASPLNGAVLTIPQVGKFNSFWAGVGLEVLLPVHCYPLLFILLLLFLSMSRRFKGK